MRPLAPAELLEIWEQAQRQTPVDQALSLLERAIPERSRDELSHLTAGERDSRLLNLRESVFGSRVEATCSCPKCHERLDLSFDISSIRCKEGSSHNHELAHIGADLNVRFRLPTSSDLLDTANVRDDTAQYNALLGRCLLEVRRNGMETSPQDLPADVLTEVVDKMAQEDPQGDVQLLLSCPQCSHHWNAPFDIATFLWREIGTWRESILREVHILASAYGWSEREILAMNPLRRREYLAMVQA